jgi:serine/threonine-protein kinase
MPLPDKHSGVQSSRVASGGISGSGASTPDEVPGVDQSWQPDHDVELEPTMTFDESDTSSDETMADETMADESHRSPSVSSEATVLLRSRLRYATAFSAVAYLAYTVFNFSCSGPVPVMVAPWLALRCLLSIVVLGSLSNRFTLTYEQLRRREYFFFGSDTLLFMAIQYVVNLQLIDHGDSLNMIAFEKNGVIRQVLTMMMYGLLIPNNPKTTARVVLTMAALPIVILTILLHDELETNVTDNVLASVEHLGSNVMGLLLGAGMAIFTAHVLHGLRRELQAVRSLGQYRLLEKLGEGGMGAVYLAEHQLLKRPCALKLISPDLKNNSIALARFEREVRSAAMLSHPNTIEIYDYGRAADGTFYFVMEYLPGLSLADLVREGGPLSPGRVVYLMRQVCGSLAEAHRMGLVHRDLKPANILVAILGGECDVSKVLDFGLVKLDRPDDGLQLTADYTVSGTPSFMSPEQATGELDIDGRADLYALGAVLYFLLTGKPPFERDNPMKLMIAHVSEPVRPPSEICSDVPADLEAVVLRCLAKKPDDRYADARELAMALDACGCAADWNSRQAETWWLAHAAAQEQQAVSPTSQPEV